MAESSHDCLALSIVVTVVSGKTSLRECLASITAQQIEGGVEIIVPYDRFCQDVVTLSSEFPSVVFHEISDLGRAADSTITAHAHRLYDRRRAVGLGLCKGRIVAMTEDHAVPADDWCSQILVCHTQPYAAIGGAIENGVDRPMNWAWYYCDFGRYGRPMEPATSDYISDVNVAYKREGLEAVRDAWQQAYHETTVHWLMQQRGYQTYRDPRMVVAQHRPELGFVETLKERWQWAGVFAETRLSYIHFFHRLVLILGAPLLPMVLTMRAVRYMLRQRRGLRQMLSIVPLVVMLTTVWSMGECFVYCFGSTGSRGHESTCSH